jgi:ABC-2 type transport system permease protein
MAGAGTLLGVRLSGGEWLKVVYLLLIGLIPLAVLGILIGHLISADALAPVTGGVVTLLALLGGSYGFLIAKSGFMFDVVKALPSYWLVQAGKVAIGGGGWPAQAWIVTVAWTASWTAGPRSRRAGGCRCACRLKARPNDQAAAGR